MIGIDLTGKTALVTGGGQGLGKATARVLYQAGAHVVVNYLDDSDGQNRKLAESVALELGDRAAARPGDVRDEAQVRQLVEGVIETFGHLDIVVNNAAVLRDRTVTKMTHGDWSTVIDTNLTAVFGVCKEAAAGMRDGGRIVNMASISGMLGFFGQANYAAAKAGVIGLTKVLSKELARRRITVNAVAPGVALTDMGQSIPEKHRDQMLKQIPLGRFAEPEEIANAILFLCSPLADYITGQTIHVNGGWIG